jgi:putative membrane protein insertion efficiency factor
MKYIILAIIWIYQKTLSFDHGLIGKLFPGYRICIYHPSCSEYGSQAIRKYGTFIGGTLAAMRIIRCSPLSQGGEDPLKEIKIPKWLKPLTWM